MYRRAPAEGRNGEPGFGGLAVDASVTLAAGVPDDDGRAGWDILGEVAGRERWEGMVTPGMTKIGRTCEEAAAAVDAEFVAGAGVTLGD